MKRKILSWIVIVCMCITMIPGQAFADSTIRVCRPYDGATYELEYKVLLNNTVVITGSTKNPQGQFVIPNEIGGNPVISIGDYAFSGCSGLTGDLIIPEGVTSIGDYAFSGCSGLTGSLTIPAGVTSIGDSAFSGCSGLTGSLTIPEGVTSIGDSAFSGCSGLTGDLIIPEGVTSIGSSAFFDCKGFTGELIIPKGVTTIKSNTFFNCSGFTGNLTIPEGVTTIGRNAFALCSGFTGSLTIPKGVTSIGDYAFNSCYRLTGDLIIPEGVTTIGKYVFNTCDGFTGKLIIPKGVTYIGESAFKWCKGLTGDLIIPEGVTSIGSYAFEACKGLTGDLIIPEGVTSIGKHAFNACYRFTGNVILPKSIQRIHYNSLGNSVNNIYYEGTEEDWNSMWKEYDIFVSNKIYFNITDINEGADYSKVDAAIATIPDDLAQYGEETVKVVIDAKNAVVRNLAIIKQHEVDKMAKDIEDAIAGLKFRKADYSKVDIAISKIPTDLSKYIEETVKVVIDAKNAVVYDLDFKKQIEVDRMAKAIENAVAGLKLKKADYSKVDVAIAKIPKDMSKCSAESVKAVMDAKNAVIRGFNISKQAEVDKMAKAIEDAIAGLKLKKADYSKVDVAIAKIPKDLSKYIDTTVKAVIDAKNAVIYNLDFRKQAEVDRMAKAIENAVVGLKLKKADYSKVDVAIAKIPKDLSKYTDESIKVVIDAKNAVIFDLDHSKQAEVDRMAKAIEDAVARLVLKPAEPTLNPEKPVVKPDTVQNVEVDTDNGLVKVTFDKVVDADSYRVYLKQVNKDWRYYITKNNSLVIKKLYKKNLVKNGKYEVKVVALNETAQSEDSQIVTVFANRIGTKSAVMYAPKFTSVKQTRGTLNVVANKVYVKNTPKNLQYKVSYKLKGTNKWNSVGYGAKNVKSIKGLKKGKVYNLALRYRYQSSLDGKTYVYSKPVYKTVRVR